MDLAIDKFDPERFGLITGSPCSVLFPDKGDGKAGMSTYAKELANQMYFRYYDEVATWQMQHGNMNENEALLYYQGNHDFGIDKGCWKRKGNFGGTSDALAKDYGADLKCPTSLKAWLDYIHEGINKQQYHQAQMYMYLFDVDLWKVCPYLAETEWMIERGLVYPVPQDKRMIVIEVRKDATWEERLNANAPFVISERDKYYQILVNQFGEPAHVKKEPKKDYSEELKRGKELKKKLNI